MGLLFMIAIIAWPKVYNNCLYGPNIISLNKQSDVTKALIDNSDALFF